MLWVWNSVKFLGESNKPGGPWFIEITIQLLNSYMFRNKGTMRHENNKIQNRKKNWFL